MAALEIANQLGLGIRKHTVSLYSEWSDDQQVIVIWGLHTSTTMETANQQEYWVAHARS